MVQTRSMSNDTKTAATDTKTAATDTKIVVRASKQTRKRKNDGYYLKRPTIDSKAMCIFMEDYMIRHPPNIIPRPIDEFDALDFAGQNEWKQMSALEKEPYIKMAMKRMEKITRGSTSDYSREPPPHPNAKTISMLETDTKIVARASKQQTRKRKNDGYYLKRPTIDSKAMCIFMKDYMIRHPPNIIPRPIDEWDALDFAGQNEWKQMSAREKEPYIKMAMERMEKPAY